MVLPCHILCHQICFWSVFESLQLLQPVCDVHTSPSVSRQNRRCSSLTSQFKNKGKWLLSGYSTNTFEFLVHKSKSSKNDRKKPSNLLYNFSLEFFSWTIVSSWQMSEIYIRLLCHYVCNAQGHPLSLERMEIIDDYLRRLKSIN